MPADGSVAMTGSWADAQRIALTMQGRFQKAIERAVLKEANYLRSQMVKGIASGAPGGAAFAPLSPMTLALRAAGGFGGTKPLIRTGALRSSITVVKLGQGRVFVGVHRSAKGPGGSSLVNVAQAMEFGAHPTRTLRQRRFLMATLRRAGITLPKGVVGAPRGSKINIPPRPFIGPVLRVHGKPADVRRRFAATIAAAMGGDFGKGLGGGL
jgi:hypothetical protein